MNPIRVLVLDDNEAVRLSVSIFLADRGCVTEPVATVAAALRALERQPFDLAIADYLLPDGTALDLLTGVRDGGYELPVILLTGHSSIELAVRAIHAGAEQFLTKPLELPALLALVQRTADGRRSRRREGADRARARQHALDPFVGSSPQVRQLAEDARRIAAADLPVLLAGEAGSGKGVLAAWLHAHGPRRREALVEVDCAGRSASRLERELFGDDGAAEPALLELAHRGSLFVDDLGDLEPAVQARLLDALAGGRARRRAVDVRLIAATRVDRHAAAPAGRFERDLQVRIGAPVLRVPALRERPEDLAALARAILEARAAAPALAADAIAALEAYPWPGNLRELRNVLERAALLCDRPTLTARDLRLTPDEPRAADDRRLARGTVEPLELVSLEENERRYLMRVLESRHGRVDECARALDLPLATLHQRLERLGIVAGT
ncbi:MAG TPA: sigma 54-interacting transcriptional regulator [Kofleriaceae bacterium]|nr:sigma 54-interacting transcriptional regulator [Kofleriaceae bacterium]